MKADDNSSGKQETFDLLFCTAGRLAGHSQRGAVLSAALIQLVFLNKTSYFARPVTAVPAGAPSQLRLGV